jgi:hypothetical protein
MSKRKKKGAEEEPCQTEYVWHGGGGPVDPNVAGAALDEIRRAAGGRLLPADVVEAARHPDHPLHRCFNWDDTEAARRWREQQAGRLICRLRIRVIPRKEGVPVVRLAYLSPQERPAQGYLPAAQAMDDQEIRKGIIATALAQLRGWERRCRDIEELAEVANDVRKALERYEQQDDE